MATCIHCGEVFHDVEIIKFDIGPMCIYCNAANGEPVGIVRSVYDIAAPEHIRQERAKLRDKLQRAEDALENAVVRYYKQCPDAEMVRRMVDRFLRGIETR